MPKAAVRRVRPVKAAPAVKKPKQSRLPGMADPKIPELHAAAEEYVSVRDHRMQLTEEEVDLKENVRQLMVKHEKMTYVCDDIEIRRVPEAENVKVKRLKKAKDEE